MTNQQQIKWWLYFIGGVPLLLFFIPMLVSADNTFAVVGGVLLLIAFGTLSWHFWIKDAFKSIKGKL